MNMRETYGASNLLYCHKMVNCTPCETKVLHRNSASLFFFFNDEIKYSCKSPTNTVFFWGGARPASILLLNQLGTRNLDVP